MNVRVLAATAFAWLVVAGCGSGESGGPSGTGGSTSTGGALGTGGAGSGGLAGTGGTTSTGGRAATGGSTGSGGRVATGGVPGGSGGVSTGGGSGGVSTGGSGGTRGSGGSPGTGGTNGTGGANGTGGSASGGHAGAAAGGATGAAGGTGSGGVAGRAGTGGAGSGGAGTSPYNPCPTNGDPCKILPLGDSITHGHGSSDDAGYRSWLFKLIVAASQKVTFTGSLTNGPTQVSGQTFPRSHEGHDGWTIDPGYSSFGSGGISSLVPSPAFDGKPHIVLLHIGTNDTGAMDAANMSTRLESLLDKIAQTSPSSLIVLAQITPLGYASSALTAYNAKIPGIVQAHAAKGQHIVGVDMSKMPVPADIASDNVHPNDQGYGYMADIWYAAIKGLLPM